MVLSHTFSKMNFFFFWYGKRYRQPILSLEIDPAITTKSERKCHKLIKQWKLNESQTEVTTILNRILNEDFSTKSHHHDHQNSDFMKSP
jgi:hypothetical protein